MPRGESEKTTRYLCFTHRYHLLVLVVARKCISSTAMKPIANVGRNPAANYLITAGARGRRLPPSRITDVLIFLHLDCLYIACSSCNYDIFERAASFVRSSCLAVYITTKILSPFLSQHLYSTFPKYYLLRLQLTVLPPTELSMITTMRRAFYEQAICT